MKKTAVLFLFVSLGVKLLHAQSPIYPSIKDYGGMFDVPFATVKPDTSITYKIVVEMGGKIENKSEIPESLDHAARMHNLFVYGKVPKRNIQMAVVVYASSIMAMLNNEEYHKRFGVDNPNTKLIKELKEAGVELIVCGQSVMRAKVDPKTVNSDVQIAISRMTSVSTFQMKGYAFFIF